MGKKSAPAPDYRGAAEEQGQSSREAINMQTYANRANQVTPFGTQTWQPTSTVDPATGQRVTRWTQTTRLTPDMQRALDAQQGLTTGRSELAGSMIDRVRGELGGAPDYSGIHARGEDVSGVGGAGQYTGQAGEALASAFEARMGPQFQRQQAELETQLRNRGVRPGDEAYDQALTQLRQSQGDQRNQMMAQAQAMNAEEAQRLQGMDIGSMQSQLGASQYANTQRQQDLAEMLQQRGWSLNEANALITGQQVGMPQMPQYNPAGAAQPVNYMGAAQQQGQFDQNQTNAANAMFGQVLGAVSNPFGMWLGNR